METTVEESLKEKMFEAYKLAYRIAYTEDDEVRPLTDAEEELPSHATVWGWVDGLTEKYLQRMIEGRCSLQESIDFDMTEFERQVDEDIVAMKGKLSVLKGF